MPFFASARIASTSSLSTGWEGGGDWGVEEEVFDRCFDGDDDDDDDDDEDSSTRWNASSAAAN